MKRAARSEKLDRMHLFFDLGDTLADLKSLGPMMAVTLLERFPSIGTSADNLGQDWVASTARDTTEAQGVRYRSGLSIASESLQRVLLDVGIEVDLDGSLALVHKAWDRYLEIAKLHGDVTAGGLEELRGMTEAMAIVTDSETSMVEPLLRRLAIAHYFDAIVVSDSAGVYKPDPRIYTLAMSKIGASPGQSIFVSNSVTDLRGAAQVGMGAIWINRERRTRPLGMPRLRSVTSFRFLSEVLRNRSETNENKARDDA